ncbi:MAG: hypothetical protein ACFFED_02260 [Candidatus Thorarchaeota archaeon]
MTSKDQTKDEKLPLVLELNATTWRVLIGMLTLRRAVGPGELTKHLGLSSPGQCMYHLNKLMEEDIIEKNTLGEYTVRPDANLDFLDNFLFLKNKVVPRTILYAIFVSSLLALYILFVPFEFGIHNVFALLLGISGAGFLWAEVYRIWNGLI